MTELKRVSFNVAKAIKEAGCPFSYEVNEHFAKYFPSYINVRLWLWREKKISIELTARIKNVEANVWDNKDIHDPISLFDIDDRHNCQDTEETIAAAIEYLVDNKLLK